jgi:hypothetical protein
MVKENCHQNKTKIFESIQIWFKVVNKNLNMFEKAENYIKGIKRKLRKPICSILVDIPEMQVLLLSVSEFAP